MTRTAEQRERTTLELVVRTPKTLGRGATVTDARTAFANDRVHMLLVTESGRLLGTLVRDDLPADLAGDDLAIDHSTLTERTIAPDVSGDDALALLRASGERRRALVDADGQLLGLLCLKRKRTGFCSEADLAAREAERR